LILAVYDGDVELAVRELTRCKERNQRWCDLDTAAELDLEWLRVTKELRLLGKLKAEGTWLKDGGENKVCISPETY